MEDNGALYSSSTEYLDGFQYSTVENDLGTIHNNGLQFVPTAEGYFDFVQNKYIYQYKGLKREGKITNGTISFDLSDLKIGGEVKVFKGIHIGGELNVGEAINGTVNTINMVGTAVQNYFQEKINDVMETINNR